MHSHGSHSMQGHSKVAAGHDTSIQGAQDQKTPSSSPKSVLSTQAPSRDESPSAAESPAGKAGPVAGSSCHPGTAVALAALDRVSKVNAVCLPACLGESLAQEALQLITSSKTLLMLDVHCKLLTCIFESGHMRHGAGAGGLRRDIVTYCACSTLLATLQYVCLCPLRPSSAAQ